MDLGKKIGTHNSCKKLANDQEQELNGKNYKTFRQIPTVKRQRKGSLEKSFDRA